MDHKTYELAECKADSATGTFQALASVFGNVDRGGDRMMPGAFTKTLEERRASGKALPIVWSHNHDDLDAYIGKADPRAIYEDERGLVQGQLNMDEPAARKARKLVQDGAVGWSFGYREVKSKTAKDGANEIFEVELFETGPTLVGMNSEARVESVKQDRDPLEPDGIVSPGQIAAAKLAQTVNEKRADENLPPVEGGDETHIADTSPESDVPAPEDAHTEEPHESPAKLSAQGSLGKAHDDLVFELTTMGVDLRQPPRKETPEPGPDPPTLDELRRQHDALTYEILTRGVAE